MAKKVKRTPKSKNSRHEKDSGNLIAFLLIIGFLVIFGLLFYYFKPYFFQNNEIVAFVNGKDISLDELEWWYKISINPEKAYLVSKKQFLKNSLIPQELAMQKAKEKGIEATEEEVERLIGSFLIDNGMTTQEFEESLMAKGLAISDARKSFEVRAIIFKLLGEENVTDLNSYANNLAEEADIKIFAENIDKLTLKDFRETKDDICAKGNPIIRIYTTSWCSSCNSSIAVFNSLIKDYADSNKVTVLEWSLDTGDNLVTAKMENGIPESEAEIFKKYSPNSLVLAIVAGCKYTRIGSLNYAHASEFNAIMKNLIGE